VAQKPSNPIPILSTQLSVSTRATLAPTLRRPDPAPRAASSPAPRAAAGPDPAPRAASTPTKFTIRPAAPQSRSLCRPSALCSPHPHPMAVVEEDAAPSADPAAGEPPTPRTHAWLHAGAQ